MTADVCYWYDLRITVTVSDNIIVSSSSEIGMIVSRYGKTSSFTAVYT